MTEVFADTFYFLALINPDDAAHRAALTASSGLSATLVTTDYVLVELADALADSRNRTRCAAFVELLRRQRKCLVVPATHVLLNAGFDLYKSRSDKDWSLTDCLSFVVMQQRHIMEALTGDHHYEQAGFMPLLK